LTGEDSLCNAEGGQAAAQKVASDPTIVGVIGTNCSSAATAALPVISGANLVMGSPSNTAPTLTAPPEEGGVWQPGYYRTAHNDLFQGKVAADFAWNELGARKVATIHDGSPYAESLQQVFADRIRELGGEVTFQGAVNVGDTDMRPILQDIASNPPDVLYFPIFEPEGPLIVAQAAEVEGLKDTILMGADGLLVESFPENAGSNAIGMYLSGPYITGEKYEELLAKWEAKYGGSPPSGFHAHAYDATNILLDAIEKVAQVGEDGSVLIGRQALRDAIYSTKDYPGVTGTLTCNQYGDCATGEALGIFQITAKEVDEDNWPPPVVWTPSTGKIGEGAMEGEMEKPDLTGKTITIYHFGDLSGPYAAITGPLIHGAEDAVKAINESGGIYGATLEVKFSDTGGSVDEAVAAYERFTSEDDNILLMITYGSGEAEALAARFAEDKIPNIAAGLSAKAFYGADSGYTFGLGPIYPDQIGLTMKFLKENWDQYKPEGAGDEIKLAYLSWPTAFGQGALTPESRAYLADLGIEIVAEETYDVSPTADTTAAILNAQAAGANVIWTNTLAFGPAAILNDLQSLGLRDQFVVTADNWAMDLSLYAFLADPAYGVGLITPFPYLWWTDADNPGIQYAQQIFEANERPAAERNVGYLLLVAGVDLARAAIQHAIDTVGFDNLTGEAVHDALIDISPYQPLNGVFRADYRDGSRSPHESQIRMIQGGPDKFVVIQDWAQTPDLRPAQ